MFIIAILFMNFNKGEFVVKPEHSLLHYFYSFHFNKGEFVVKPEHHKRKYKRFRYFNKGEFVVKPELRKDDWTLLGILTRGNL